MSDFFSHLERELITAAERRARRRLVPRMRWTRRTALVLLPATVLVAVPAFAAVTGVFHRAHHPHHAHSHFRPPDGTLVDLGPHCTVRVPRQHPPSTSPPPSELMSLLGVLRRPRTPADQARVVPDFLENLSGVNPDYIRVVRVQRHGPTLIVVPAENIHARPLLPNTPACRGIGGPTRPPQAGVCLIVRVAGGASAGCQSIDELKRGGPPGGSSGGGLPRGAMQVAGLVPDGVTSVSLIYRTRGTATRVNVPVVQNTYVALVRGVRLGALRPTVVWHGPGGSRVVVKGGSTITPRMRRLMRRSLARDRAATRVPSVLPRVGRAKTIFTLRVRPPRPKSVHGLYVLTLRGPDSTDCRRRASRRLGATPASHGQRKGVIDILYGPGELGGGARWCRGAYNGRIELWPHGFRHGFSHRPYARFSFRVR